MNKDRKITVGVDAVGRCLPTALAVHDLSCFGKCALTVIIPALSASGVQTVPIPTALLSTHTGGFKDFYFEDMTSQVEKISEHLHSINVETDAVYTGFLGSKAQIKSVGKIIDDFRQNSPLVLVDPVMGDDGRLYSTITQPLVEGMKQLCLKADVITPNMTEACFLTDTAFVDTHELSESEARAYVAPIVEKLKSFGVKSIALTGIHFDNGKVATYAYDRTEGESFYANDRIKASYPGTGDLFASVLLGKLLKSEGFSAAVAFASDFTKRVIEYSSQFDYPTRQGVLFEPFLKELN